MVNEGYRLVIRKHVFDKCRALDITWTEVEELLGSSEVVEEEEDEDEVLRVKQVSILEGWRRPLHVVTMTDHERRIVIVVTIYEPHRHWWRPGFRQRRR